MSARIHVWRWPIAIAMASMVGLVAALIDDGLWDGIAWATLAIPVLLSCWGCYRAWRSVDAQR